MLLYPSLDLTHQETWGFLTEVVCFPYKQKRPIVEGESETAAPLPHGAVK